MKTTKKHTQRLESIRHDLQRGLDYIHRDDIQVCRITDYYNSLVYQNREGDMLATINKEVGGAIQYLENALKKIEAMLSDIA